MRYKNNCTFTSTTSPGAQAADAVDTTPCPAVGNTLLVSKSGNDAVLNWSAVTCADLSSYRVYAVTAYDTPFPSGWTTLGNPTGLTFSDPLTSSYIAYKISTIDACGNSGN